MALQWGAGISLKGLKGDTGQRGSIFYETNGMPTDQNAGTNPNDFALDTTTQLLYTRGQNGWPTDTNAGVLLRGAMGLTGVNGASFYSGANVPDSSVPGNDGDLYLVLTTGEVYKHVSGTWTDQGYSIRGPKGDKGDDGIRGSQRYVGHGPPPSDLSTLTPAPAKNDEYVDLDGGPTVYFLS